MSSIVTVTLNPALDMSCLVDQVRPEHKLACSEVRSDPGGGGINAARVVRELGGDPRAVWTCGGSRGELLAQRLESSGLTHEPVPVRAETRENLTVGERASGQQFRFAMPGPELDADERQRCLDAVRAQRPDCLVLSGSLPKGVNDDLYADMAYAAPAQTRVLVDTRGPPLHCAVEAGVFAIKPNLRELGELVGRELEDDAAIDAACHELVGEGKVQLVVVSLGASGAHAVSANEGSFRVRAPTVPIRSKVGAGDSTVGGLVYKLARGSSLHEAVAFAVAAGAAAVMTPGTELCRRDDVQRLFAAMEM